MNRRKICSLCMAFLSGVAAVEYRQPLLWCILVLFAVAWIAAMAKEDRISARAKSLWVAAFVAAALIGGADGYRHQTFLDVLESRLEDGQSCMVQGEIYQKERDGERSLYYLKHCRMKFDSEILSCHQILLYLKAESYSIGEILCVRGTIKTFRLPANEGNYHERSYYQSLDITCSVEDGEVLFVSGKAKRWKNWLWQVRRKMQKSYEEAMPQKDAGVLTAMTLGDKSQMDLSRKEAYRSAGISHFYSISGLHISMLGMALYHILKKRGASFFSAGVLSAAFILSYGEMIGFGVSASRAIGMFLVLLYAKFRGRSYDQATSLALMAAIFAGENPGLLHHAGFLLSFGAVGGVLLAGQFAREKSMEDREKEKSKIAKKIGTALQGVRETFLVSVCIQFVTIPVLCQNFYEISVYAPLVNLVVLPCMGILLGMGILGGVLGCFLPFAGKMILFPCYWILMFFDDICSLSRRLPCSTLITGALPVRSVVLWYALLAAFLLMKANMRKPTLVKFFLALKLPVLLLCFGLLLLARRPPGFEIDFLDVGQGDGIYLSAGDGTHLFLDGGSSDVQKVGGYRILPFLKYKGIRRIDYWFVSHCDADHISGLCEALEAGYSIRHLVVSKFMPKDEAWQNLKSLANQRQVKVIQMDVADALKGDGWGMKCLWPEAESISGDRNKNSLVLLFESDEGRGFFAGDIGEEEEKKLLGKWKLPDMYIYKASHHGSKTSNSGELLEVLRPEIAVISCGLHNRYGHPGKETLERLEESCGKICETRWQGQIKIKNSLKKY